METWVLESTLLGFGKFDDPNAFVVGVLRVNIWYSGALVGISNKNRIVIHNVVQMFFLEP